ncbi:class I SAM-dependent methyltransferase [Lysinibacillus macroides]|uniref:SAM-dependent methyltransferase n=1 Tax=Lysinibacillus macroides TaxID=33935 RepID=A0A0N0CWQ0_9BACI|nr:class I SAM-dependent methyltransferase [Lysinibacillus macroides]KOY83424.1 SAM-dependent methyltransferase [Lysinibacillus macroides]QPR69294.1 class I SAM-dependent methyltransferase [Lysinibacillus macroides]
MSLLQTLIEQVKKPTGRMGVWMLRIMNRAHRGMYAWFIRQGAVNDGTCVLDIGCGGGKMLQILASLNPNGMIYGIDISEQAVKESLKLNNNNKRIVVTQASVSKMPYHEQFFDTITAFQTHYFWPSLEQDVKEIGRVLKDGGKLIVMAETYKMKYHMEAFQTPAAMKQLLEHTGFQTVYITEKTSKGWLCMTAIK